MAIFYPQKILTTNKTEVTFAYNNYSSMIFTNTHDSAAITIDLYVTSQIGTDITDTGVDVNLSAGYAITTASQNIVVDGGTFTDATCDTTSTDATVTHDDDDGKITVLSLVSGPNIPDGAYVASVTSDTEFELSAVATGSATNTTLSFIRPIDEVFLNEQVWKSNGTLFGTCTTVGSSAGMTFGGGLVRAMANNDDLYVGTRHHFLNNVKIPNGASLKLSADEFKFDDTNYKLYIKTDAIGIDIITRY